jgi:hypothetical protein
MLLPLAPVLIQLREALVEVQPLELALGHRNQLMALGHHSLQIAFSKLQRPAALEQPPQLVDLALARPMHRSPEEEEWFAPSAQLLGNLSHGIRSV